MATATSNPLQRRQDGERLGTIGTRTTWTLDAANSSVTFRARQGIAPRILRARFLRLRGAAVIEPDHTVRARLVLEADSLSSGWRLRDRRLLSRAYLDAMRHPEIRVEVTSGRLQGSGGITVHGELVVHGHRESLRCVVKLTDLDLSCEHLGVEANLCIERHRLAMRGRVLLRGDAILGEARLRFVRSTAVAYEISSHVDAA